MKPLILDHLKRWGWVWGLIGLIQFGISFNTDPHRAILHFQLPIFLGALLLMVDLQRGLSRALLTLPVSIRQVSRTLWWVAVGLPALFLTALITLAAILAHVTGIVKELPYEYYVFNGVATLLWLGSIFLILTGMPGRPPVGFREQVQAALFGGFWGLSFVGAFFLFDDFHFRTTKGMLVMIFGTAFTLAGWFRAEHLVRQRAAGRAASPRLRNVQPQYRVHTGFGGLPYLWRTLLIPVGYIGLLFLGVLLFWGVIALLKTQRLGQSHMSPLQWVDAMTIPIGTFSIVGALIILLPMITHLRFLRTLPISSDTIAATLVFAPVALIIAMGAFVAALTRFSSGVSTGLFIPQSCLFGVLFVSIGVPLIVWRGLSMGSYFVLVLMAMAGNILPVLAHAAKSSPLEFLCISILAIVSAFIITRFVLAQSSQPYRVRLTTVGQWQGMGR